MMSDAAASSPLLAGAAISVLCAVAPAAPAFAAPTAYPPGKRPPPRTTMPHQHDRRPSRRHLLQRGSARAGKPGAIRIGGSTSRAEPSASTGAISRGSSCRTRLTRGTKIRFLVGGKVVATLRA